LARAEVRFSKVEEFILPRQCDAWQSFRDRLRNGPGELFNIQVAGLWQKTFLANADRFNAHMKGCLLPLDWSTQSTRSQKEQKRLLVGEAFAYAGAEEMALSGEALSAAK